MIWLLLLALCVPSAAFAQTYETLQLMRPLASGAAGTGLHASNRVYRAYSGIEYNIHADARGGKWPYTYSLSNAPAGMTIEAGPCTVIGPTCTAGTITWSNPTSTASNITVRVTDSLGSYVEGTWTVTVSTTIGADGFCFVDVNNAAGGRNGSLANPYNSLLEVYNSCGARSILYLRGGTYSVPALRSVCALGGDGEPYGYVCQFAEGSRPIIWIGYPGETAILDFEATGSNSHDLISTSGSNTWVDNLTLQNVGNIGFRFNVRNSYGAVVRRITGTDIKDGEESMNTAFFMWSAAAYPDQSYWDTVQNSTFTGIAGDGAGSDNGCHVKLYGNQNSVIETSSYDGSTFPEAVIAVKSSSSRITIRANTCGVTTAVKSCIGGNMARDTNNEPLSATGGEIYHNLMKTNASSTNDGALTLVEAFTQDTSTFAIYRNTIIGQWLAKHFSGLPGSGPYTFYDNVIVNDGGTGGSCPLRADCVLNDGVWDYSYWADNGDNVMGLNDESIVNSTTGALVGSSRTTYLGVAGFELYTVTRLLPPSLLRR